MHPLSNIFAIGLAGVILAFLAYDLRRGVVRVLSGRSAVLVAVMYWYLLEALRLPKDLEIYTQSEYNFGLLCVFVSVVAFLVAYHQSRLELFNRDCTGACRSWTISGVLLQAGASPEWRSAWEVC